MSINIPILIGAALIDSINPCAFGVLIFLLAYLAKTTQTLPAARRSRKLLTHGLVFILAVFLTYLIVGITLLPIISNLGRVGLWVYAAIGILVIIAGLIELKDFFWYGRGFSLALIPGAAKRIKLYTKKISDNLSSAFLLGVFVALVELPCTGAVYLAVLSLMSLAGVSISSVFLLILYNLIFVLPLVVILILVSRGAATEKIEAWRKRNRRLMRLLIGLLLIALGGWMLWFALI